MNVLMYRDPITGEMKLLRGARGPKGDPGDDYVLTEADKQEIAGMVEVPDTYTKGEIDAIMGSYITDIDTLIGGEA